VKDAVFPLFEGEDIILFGGSEMFKIEAEEVERQCIKIKCKFYPRAKLVLM
jgi:hypothetical protein